MEPNRVKIRQSENFSSSFGHVLRSSAIFYCKEAGGFKTTISFMNYWKLKRGLEIAVVASVRDMDGKLIRREQIDFSKGEVANYRPLAGSEFEGSIEIEVFSARNMVIPYSAIMAIYETNHDVSMVHSYGRVYSPHEVEEGRTLSVGEESCWTVRDDERIRSYCVLHNGGHEQPAQTARLTVRNLAGEQKTAEIALEALPPRSTRRIEPSKHIADLGKFLGGKPGNATLSFLVCESFTRMLVGNETLDGSEHQCTHSNFNFSRHSTDGLSDSDAAAYMRIPTLGARHKAVAVYPDAEPGKYDVSDGARHVAFESGKELFLPADGVDCFAFRKKEGDLPTRIVTALVIDREESVLPTECSLGVLTKLQPPKRLWWGVCASDDVHGSDLVIHDMPEVYGGMPANGTLHVRLFSEASGTFIECARSADDLARFSDGIAVDELFPDAREFLAGGFGYYTVFSEYPGLTCYTLMKRHDNGRFVFEHGF